MKLIRKLKNFGYNSNVAAVRGKKGSHKQLLSFAKNLLPMKIAQ